MKKCKENSSNSLLIILMIICVLLSLITLGIVVYDRLISNNNCNSSNSMHECWNK